MLAIGLRAYLCVVAIQAENVMDVSSNNRSDLEREVWLNAILPLSEAARLKGISIDTLKRQGERGEIEILKLSPRRRGVRRRAALMLAG